MRLRDCRVRLLVGFAGSTACVLIALLTSWGSTDPLLLFAWAAVALFVTLGGAAWLSRAAADAQPRRLVGIVKAYALATAFVWATAPASYVDGGGSTAHLFMVIVPLGAAVAWYWMFATVPAAMALVGVTLAGATSLRLILVGGEALYPLAALVLFAFAVLFLFARGYGDSLVEAWADARERVLREAEIHSEVERAVAGERERYVELFDNALEGLFQARLGGGVTAANPAMARIFGFDAAAQVIEAADHDWRALLVNPALGMALEAELLADGASGDFECEVSWPDGAARWVSISARRLHHDDDSIGFEGRVLDITARKHVEFDLERQIEWLERAEATADIGRWYWNLDSGELNWSPQTYRLYGLDPDTHQPCPELALSAFHRDDRERVIEAFDQAILTQRGFQVEARLLRASGAERTVMLRGDCEVDEGGRLRALFGLIQNVTEGRLAEQALRRSEAFYRAVVEAQSELIFRCLFDGVVTFANQAFCRFFGVSRDQAIGGALFDASEDDMILPPDTADTVRATLEQLTVDSPQSTAEIAVPDADGTTRWLLCTLQALFDERDHLIEYQTVALDITDRKAADSRIAHMAHHDALTGLPNRVLFRDHLELAKAQADRSGRKVAVLMLDLDHFKNINDGLGHDAGDRLLVDTAHRLTDCVRAADTVARLGGDEFAIIQADISDGGQAVVLAERIVGALAAPFDVDGHQIHSGTSIGITVYPDDGRGLDQLLKNADMALYRAKESERGSFDFYSIDLGRRAHNRMEIAQGLARALDQDQFSLVYQPKFDGAGQVVVGVEALIRWQHPERGTMKPAEFIPVAESSGLILAIGEWVLRAACAQLREWRESGLAPLPLAINISAAQFRDRGLAAKVRDALASEKIDPGALEIEITETALMRDAALTTTILNDLVALGVRASIDDFGTGYSSLNYLREFPVSKLKIDRSFVSDIDHREENAAIAKAITHLGHSLGLKVVAEGVETEAELGLLQDIGCDEVQGYLFSRPMPAEEFACYLGDRAPSRPARAARDPALVDR